MNSTKSSRPIPANAPLLKTRRDRRKYSIKSHFPRLVTFENAQDWDALCCANIHCFRRGVEYCYHLGDALKFETKCVEKQLIKINRGGFMTSVLGVGASIDGYQSRAYVWGFVENDEVASELRAFLLSKPDFVYYFVVNRNGAEKITESNVGDLSDIPLEKVDGKVITEHTPTAFKFPHTCFNGKADEMTSASVFVFVADTRWEKEVDLFDQLVVFFEAQ